MASKDERPGLLSKVAMFVRNPTRDWSELDQLSQSAESDYDKQALKAMIERKRQNDFVCKRELDQLRKLRNRDPGAVANVARPSYFLTSLPTDPNGHALTLKKIDEIEAQMSKQWWRGKNESAVLPVERDSSAAPAQAESTQALDDFVATRMATDVAALHAGHDGRTVESHTDATGTDHPAKVVYPDELATDPELEEAAIRFANGDDAGAERGLLLALRGNPMQPEAAQGWAAAVLDLYRATHSRAAFDDAAQEFALHLDGLVPTWANPVATADTPATPDLPMGASFQGNTTIAPGVPLWSCPTSLDGQGMVHLRDTMSVHSMPWHLGWDALTRIDDTAAPLLDGLFASLCEESVGVAFSGVPALLSALRTKTPPGDRNTDRLWWQIRLNALRVMRLHDDFELAALDYCVTHEVAPPAWVDALCHYEDMGNTDALLRGRADDPGPATVPMSDEMKPLLALRGELLGDASGVLSELEKNEAPGVKIVIDCHALVRVDFAAAGSILNWVATREAEGKQIQFHHVHRLVAAFFNVIGINEHAKVILRPV